MVPIRQLRTYPRDSHRGRWGIVLLTFSMLLTGLASPTMAAEFGGTSCTGRCDYDYFVGCVDCRFTILRGFACWSPDCAHCYELECSAASTQPPSWLPPAVRAAPASSAHASRVRQLPART